MNRRAIQAALRIRLLIEEFSGPELDEAISLLRGENGPLPVFLSEIPSVKRSSARPKSGEVSTRETRPLEALKETDPEKYQMLASFEREMREGTALSTMEDLRRFGNSLSKSFQPGKSRREGISRLIVLLKDLEEAEICELLDGVPRVHGPTPYGKLADHIISGGTQDDRAKVG